MNFAIYWRVNGDTWRRNGNDKGTARCQGAHWEAQYQSHKIERVRDSVESANDEYLRKVMDWLFIQRQERIILNKRIEFERNIVSGAYKKGARRTMTKLKAKQLHWHLEMWMIRRASPKQALKVNRKDESEDEAEVIAQEDLAVAVICNSS
jgi:hypothetical protein